MLPLYLHSSIFPKHLPQNVFAHITFSHQEESMILVLEGSHKLFWDKVISWSQPGLGDSGVSCCHSYSSHRYFSPCLKDGTSNAFYYSNWCYSVKLFLSVPAILHEGNWHLMKNLWLSKCCNSTPISIFERIKIDSKKKAGLSPLPTTQTLVKGVTHPK